MCFGKGVVWTPMPEGGTVRGYAVKGDWVSPLFLYIVIRYGDFLWWIVGAGLRKSDIEMGLVFPW